MAASNTRAKRAKPITPVRAALVEGSALEPRVADGLRAVKRAHKILIESGRARHFADSLDLDAATAALFPNDHRWDYLLGHGPSGTVVGLEPHSAKDDEITTVINKRARSMEALRSRLRPGVRVVEWFWVASGSVDFADTERARLRLDQNGIKFIGKGLGPRHLPAAPRTGTATK